MKKAECFSITVAGMPITLYQTGKDSFIVQYWKQVNDHLSYAQACTKLGQAILHALSLEGRVDNRMKGEK